MNLLAIETATNVCGAALSIDGIVVAERSLDRPRAHAENLVPMIAETLREGGLLPGAIDVIAVSAGPGSYTGLRIGASTAKGLAKAVDAALVAVPSLEALASQVMGNDGQEDGDVVVASFDARRDEVFAAAFRVDDAGLPVELLPTRAVRTEDIAEWLGGLQGGIILVGDGSAKLTSVPGARWEPSIKPTARSVARLGAVLCDRGYTVDVAEFEPRYLKEFVANKPSATAFEKLSF